MRGLHAVLLKKLDAGIPEPAGAHRLGDVARGAGVEAGRFHSWTPFSTASSSSETFSRIDPPSL